MTYSTELRKVGNVAWDQMMNSEYKNQESLLLLLEKVKTRSARNATWRYRVIDDNTGKVLCEQNQGRSWPPLQQVAAIVGRRFRRS